MLKKWAALLVGILVVPAVCAAENRSYTLEMSVGAGISHLDPDVATPLRVTDDQDAAWLLTIGQAINESWQFQFRYADLGKAEVSDVASIRYDALAMAVQYSLPLFPDAPFAVNAVAGGAAIDANASKLSMENSNSEEPLLGLSLDFDTGNHWRLRLEGAAYGQDLSILTLGIAGRF